MGPVDARPFPAPSYFLCQLMILSSDCCGETHSKDCFPFLQLKSDQLLCVSEDRVLSSGLLVIENSVSLVPELIGILDFVSLNKITCHCRKHKLTCFLLF